MDKDLKITCDHEIGRCLGHCDIANSLHEMSRISNVPLISIYRMTKGVKNMKGYELIIL